jgi:hypothetical protein
MNFITWMKLTTLMISLMILMTWTQLEQKNEIWTYGWDGQHR